MQVYHARLSPQKPYAGHDNQCGTQTAWEAGNGKLLQGGDYCNNLLL